MTKKWTQEQSVAFESAREAISDLMGIKTNQIEMEMESDDPRQEVIDSLRAERSRLARERSELRVTDDSRVKDVRETYGEMVREWRRGGVGR